MWRDTCVMLFPGQGSQRVGMGQDLMRAHPEFRNAVEEASEVLGYDMARLMGEDPDGQLNQTRFTQPAILCFSIGVYRSLKARTGLEARWVAGHSLGEYSALVALGALDYRDALRAVRYRGSAMQRAAPMGTGAMAAYIGSEIGTVDEICRSRCKEDSVVEVVNYNSPQQVVISGHRVAVDWVSVEIARLNLGKMISLPVSAPFHSRIMRGAALDMRQYLKGVTLSSFKGCIATNVDGALHDGRGYSTDMMVSQLERPVMWTRCLQSLAEAVPPETPWLELGPDKVLSNLAQQSLPGLRVHSTGDAKALDRLLAHLN